METKKCFSCKEILPLNAYKPDKRKYQLKNSKGRCVVCHECCLEKALEKMSCIRFDYELDKFVVHNFENEQEVIEFYKKERKQWN